MQSSSQKFWLAIQNQIKIPDPFWIPNSMPDFNPHSGLKSSHKPDGTYRPWIVQGILDFSGNW
jgi:hypothetical protein